MVKNKANSIPDVQIVGTTLAVVPCSLSDLGVRVENRNGEALLSYREAGRIKEFRNEWVIDKDAKFYPILEVQVKNTWARTIPILCEITRIYAKLDTPRRIKYGELKKLLKTIKENRRHRYKNITGGIVEPNTRILAWIIRNRSDDEILTKEDLNYFLTEKKTNEGKNTPNSRS